MPKNKALKKIDGPIFIIFVIIPQIIFSLFICFYREVLYPIFDPYLFESSMFLWPSILILTCFPIFLYSISTLIYNKTNHHNKAICEVQDSFLSALWIIELLVIGVLTLILLVAFLSPMLFVYRYMTAYIFSGLITCFFLLVKLIYHHFRYQKLRDFKTDTNNDNEE